MNHAECRCHCRSEGELESLYLRLMIRRTTKAGKTNSITVPTGRRICVHTNTVVTYIIVVILHIAAISDPD